MSGNDIPDREVKDMIDGYITETSAERLARLEFENDQLTAQVNAMEDRFSATLMENGRLRAEAEELYRRLDLAENKVYNYDALQKRLEVAEMSLSAQDMRVCSHSDDCADFEATSKGRAKVYRADD